KLHAIFSRLSKNDVFACACRRLYGERMKNVCFRLNDDEYELARVNAASYGVDSVNVFAKMKVLDVPTKPVSIPVKNEAAKPVFTYLYPHEIELVKRNAVLHGMSMSREIAIRVRQSLLKNEVCLYPDEIKEIRRLKTEINKLGRNVHYIISGDRFCIVNDPEFRKEINDALNICQQTAKQLETLVTAVVNRF
ncbi:DNA distortion polypeptide 1, partial [Escherichia coli]